MLTTDVLDPIAAIVRRELTAHLAAQPAPAPPAATQGRFGRLDEYLATVRETTLDEALAALGRESGPQSRASDRILLARTLSARGWTPVRSVVAGRRAKRWLAPA